MKQQRPTKGPARGRLAFLARIEGIRAALERGEYLSEIYKEEKNHLPFSYTQFTRHVRRHLGPEADKAFGRHAPNPAAAIPSPSPPLAPSPPAGPIPSAPGPIIAEGEPRKTFNHDPVPRDLDKLL